MPHLFEPLKLRNITLPHRIGIPPMCQYSVRDELANDWHFVRYGSRAVGGALNITSATRSRTSCDNRYNSTRSIPPALAAAT
ncbi:MAG: hypothetical protein ACK4Q4_07295 [Rhodocyclaceae bacterium]